MSNSDVPGKRRQQAVLIAHCYAEIAEIEAQLRAGHLDVEGLCRALADWSAELRLPRKSGK